ncbi:MAG: DUF6599 family protein [Acidobacteriota bacterium]
MPAHHSTMLSAPAPALPTAQGVDLPPSVSAWTRTGGSRRIEAATIFDYMDGAGELYLAYRFDHLDVLEYTAGEGDDILVELYWLTDPDDAFGLLSTDWGGEVVTLGAPPDAKPAPRTEAWPRALYGAGLLRVWAGNLYARVMATRESEAARSAVLTLGQRIVAGQPALPAPHLVAALPPAIGAAGLHRPSVSFLRSHLVLNSAYFLGQGNLLDLGRDTEAVIARYDGNRGNAGPEHMRLVLVRYPDRRRAAGADRHFRQAYLPEARAETARNPAALARIEDGWAGTQVRGSCLAIALECPDRGAAVAVIEAGLRALGGEEGCHD